MKNIDKIIADTVDNLRRVFQVINEHSKKAERDTGLTGPQLWAIKIIAESSPLRVSDLAQRMYLHAATVIGILDRLEAHGLVTRIRSKVDRRAVMVALSQKGKILVKNAPEVAQGLIVRGLEQLPQKMLKDISEGLQKVVEILGAQTLPPKLMLSTEVNVPNRKGAGRPKTKK
jgi:MarR family transcriptional regulator, organic hydroperoxide resistance regulator